MNMSLKMSKLRKKKCIINKCSALRLLQIEFKYNLKRTNFFIETNSSN